MLEIASAIASGYSTPNYKLLMRYTSPPNQQAYYEQVWNLVRQIPSGKVASYGQIALMIPPPMGVDFDSYKAFSPRWVGGAMAACPDDVPWQRVINSQGKISERAGAEKQRQLLEQEGVEFDAKDRVDLKEYGWKGPDEEDQVEPQQPNLF
ncbi:MAG TPA: MGMT family protein [Anaerolineales bacterium]|nr:MGMT family protein [Anaerolineales bacterium]